MRCEIRPQIVGKYPVLRLTGLGLSKRPAPVSTKTKGFDRVFEYRVGVMLVILWCYQTSATIHDNLIERLLCNIKYLLDSCPPKQKELDQRFLNAHTWW